MSDIATRIHVFEKEKWENAEVWLDTEIDECDGLCLGTAPTLDEALTQAEAELVAALDYVRAERARRAGRIADLEAPGQQFYRLQAILRKLEADGVVWVDQRELQAGKLRLVYGPKHFATLEAAQPFLDELARAEAKWPMWPTDVIHAAAIVQEEAGELVQAALQATYEGGTLAQVKTEAIQVGAMALRLLQHWRLGHLKCEPSDARVFQEPGKEPR